MYHHYEHRVFPLNDSFYSFSFDQLLSDGQNEVISHHLFTHNNELYISIIIGIRPEMR